VLSELMTNPQNLQLRVVNETKWTPDGGLHDTYILDSLVEDITYSAVHEGTIRTAEFTWFTTIHEPFPDSAFNLGWTMAPVVLRPKQVA